MFKYVFLIIFLAFILLLGTSYYFYREEIPQVPVKDQTATENEKNIKINGQLLTVEIADDPHEQSQGLSDRLNLGEGNGMLFIFPSSGTPGFWMKDMHFPLDMLWIDADGVIVAISKNISPDTYPAIFQSPSPIRYVLEVNAGWSDKNNIKAGDKMSGL